MALRITYLAANLGLFLLILYFRYWHKWPAFCFYQATACIEIASRFFFPERAGSPDYAAAIERGQSIHTPCLILLGVGIAAAGVEALYRASAGMDGKTKSRMWFFLGLIMFGLPGLLEYRVPMRQWPTFYEQVTRNWWVVWSICWLVVAVKAAGIAHSVSYRMGKEERIRQYRYIRLHTTLWAALISIAVYLTDFSQWQHNRDLWMASKVILLCWWTVNAHLLHSQQTLADDDGEKQRGIEFRPSIPPRVPTFASGTLR